MADSGIQTIAGEGEYLLPPGVLITYLGFWIDTPTVEVDYLSSGPIRRVMHAGWIATGSGQGGIATASLTFDQCQLTSLNYFTFEANGKANPSGFPFDDRILWHIPSGLTAKFQAFW